MIATPNANRISQALREDGSHYTADDLLDRLKAAVAEANRQHTDRVTVKIPSSHEVSFSLDVARQAVIELDPFWQLQ